MVECIACCDKILIADCMQAPCAHCFCPVCVSTLASLSVQDESNFPMKCCNRAISPTIVDPFLDPALRRLVATVRREFETPHEHRVYCPQVRCSSFLGSKANVVPGQTVICGSCNVSICFTCREQAHPGESCGESKAMAGLKLLAETHKWRACPRCKAIIDKTEGCNHMVCRCTQEFCYACGVPWRPRTCSH